MNAAPAEREGRLAGAGVELFARWVGDGGPTVVALHGGPGASHDYLRPQFDALAHERTILYYDQRGGGRSVVPRDVPLGWREQVADLAAIAGGAVPAPLTLLGFSWGGLLALLFAIEHPELVAPAGTHADVRARFERTFSERQAAPAIAEARAALSRSGLRERDPDAFWRRAFELSVAGYFKDPSRAKALTPFRVAAKAQRAVWESLAGLDLRPKLPGIAAETLVLHGRFDPVPLDSSEELTALMPHARLVVFEDAGHALYAEETARFVSTLDAFLPRSR
jgi:proline iminopeptidase